MIRRVVDQTHEEEVNSKNKIDTISEFMFGHKVERLIEAFSYLTLFKIGNIMNSIVAHES